MKLTIHGYSTALYATWYFIEELGLLFDAGDGVTSHLLGKSGKIKHIFISHADRDHLGGLLQYNQLNAYRAPKLYYPKDAKSFAYLETFIKQFDPHTSGTEWYPIDDGDEITIKNNYRVQSFENKHINVSGQLKSLSYKVLETKSKIKPEFKNLSSKEIVAIKEAHGDAFISTKKKRTVLAYSGDTPVFDYELFDNTEILIHEATFLTKEELAHGNDKNKHSALEEVLEMVANISTEKVILGHFSSRYDTAEVDAKIKELIKHYHIKVPIYRMPVGQARHDILNKNPIN